MLFWKQILFIVMLKECAFLSVSYHREGPNQDVALDVVCLSFFFVFFLFFFLSVKYLYFILEYQIYLKPPPPENPLPTRN